MIRVGKNGVPCLPGLPEFPVSYLEERHLIHLTRQLMPLLLNQLLMWGLHVLLS